MNKKLIMPTIALCLPLVVQSASLSEPTSLREVIPLDALGYVRIPNPWGLVSPKDNALKEAFAHEQHVQQIQHLESSIYQNILKKVEVIHPALTLFFHHLRSPVEAIALLPDNAPPTMVNALISAKLNFTSIDEVNRFVKELVAKTPVLSIKNEMSKTGDATLMAGPISILLHYELDTQTLSLMGGMATTQALFQQMLSLSKIKQHPMYDLENRIDSSHQGYFKWINLQKILSMMPIPPKIAADLQKWGLTNLRAIALGWGVRDGKGRLGVIIDAPKAGYREFFPPISNDLSLTASGKPGTVISLSIPALGWLKGFEKIAEKEMKPEQFKRYQSSKEALQKEMGFSIEDALAAFGPQFVFFTDEVGEFFAVQIGDKERVHKILNSLVEKYHLAYRKPQINGKTYHHLRVPSFSIDEMLLPSEKSEKSGEKSGFEWLMTLFSKVHSHYYWVEDEGYLILVYVPQLLFDREKYLTRISIQKWLKQEQHQDIQSSLLLISTRLTDIPRYLYYAYLNSLKFLGDMAEAQINLFALPTAMELQLPTSGTYGLQLDISDSSLAFELTFEHNPVEWLLKPNMAGVAMIGILAAVAIPAYSDYMKRSKVAEAIALLSAIKMPAEIFFVENNRFPEIEELKGVIPEQHNIRLLKTKNGYSFEFKDSDLSGKLKLIYDFEKSTWTCTHEDMLEKHLPRSCR